MQYCTGIHPPDDIFFRHAAFYHPGLHKLIEYSYQNTVTTHYLFTIYGELCSKTILSQRNTSYYIP